MAVAATTAASPAAPIFSESELTYESVLLLNAVTSNEPLSYISARLDRGADVNFLKQDCPMSLRNPLRAACANGNESIMRLLLERGARVFAHFAVDRWTALHSAAHGGKDRAVSSF